MKDNTFITVSTNILLKGDFSTKDRIDLMQKLLDCYKSNNCTTCDCELEDEEF